jgi:HD-GYP domain-containing protein (c-di-GMP phosphodiesterase class II)
MKMSGKLSVSIDKCKTGMKIAETIFNDYGGVIVSENSILDQHTIKKLQMLDIPKIKIYDLSDESIAENSDSFKEQYDAQVENIKDIIKDISSGKNLEMNRIDDAVDSVIGSVKENRDIVSCINEVRDADEYTYTHCMNVSLLSMMIGKWLKLDQNKIKDLAYAGILHDIGKAKIAPKY